MLDCLGSVPFSSKPKHMLYTKKYNIKNILICPDNIVSSIFKCFYVCLFFFFHKLKTWQFLGVFGVLNIILILCFTA